MLCPGCGLNNLTHVAKCVRCGVPLRPEEAKPVDTVPPRAGKWKKRLVNPVYRLRRRLGFRWRNGRVDYLSRSLSDISIGHQLDRVFGVLLPSFYQFRNGRKWRGIIFLSVYLLGALLTFLLLGTGYLRLGILLMVMAQTCAIGDIFQFEEHSLFRRLSYSFILSLLVFTLLNFFYVRGLLYLGNSLNWSPASPAWQGPDIYGNNILKIIPQSQYEPGDLIEFNAWVRLYGNQVQWGEGMQRGLVVDRILAGPGQTVEIRNNRIYLDGSEHPSTIMPIRPDAFRMPDDTFTLSMYEYFIFPTVGVNYWQPQFSRMREHYITGRVTRVIFPIWRWKKLY